MGTDTSGLRRFQKKLNIASDKLRNSEISQRIAEFGEREAVKNWGGYPATVYTEQSGNEYKIVAEGREVAFYEYGTGYYAYYNGNLPSSWEYYYDNPATKREVGGQLGWFTSQITGTPIFTIGMQSVAPMYRTALEMERKMAEIGIDFMRE